MVGEGESAVAGQLMAAQNANTAMPNASLAGNRAKVRTWRMGT